MESEEGVVGADGDGAGSGECSAHSSYSAGRDVLEGGSSDGEPDVDVSPLSGVDESVASRESQVERYERLQKTYERVYGRPWTDDV